MNYIFRGYQIYWMEIIGNLRKTQNMPIFHIPSFFETPCSFLKKMFCVPTRNNWRFWSFSLRAVNFSFSIFITLESIFIDVELAGAGFWDCGSTFGRDHRESEEEGNICIPFWLLNNLLAFIIHVNMYNLLLLNWVCLL